MVRGRIKPNPENCGAAELEAAIKGAASARSQVRLRAIKALLVGIIPGQVAELFSITERTARGIDCRYTRARVERYRTGQVPARTVDLAYADMFDPEPVAGERWRPGRPPRMTG